MIIELCDLQAAIDSVGECSTCHHGRAMLINVRDPKDWDIVTLHAPGCAAFIAPVRHLHPVGTSTGAGDVA